MKAERRREEIAEYLRSAQNPVSANALGRIFGVSRQVIVQDVAIMRANGTDITSTNRGYVLNASARCTRVFKCRHTLEDIVGECTLIVNAGGRVEDVFVNHRVYGRISSPLGVANKTQAVELYRSLLSGASKPLMNVTDGYHYHTVSADSERALDGIEKALREGGFLLEE